MANVAGQTIIAGRVSGEEVGSASVVSDSSNFTTTETTVITLTVSLISGCTYMLDAIFNLASSVGSDTADGRIREDSSTGTEMQFQRCIIDSTTLGQVYRLMAYYTASVSGSKTFVVTGVRSTGTGNVRLEAASTRPALLRVVYTGG